MYMCSILAAIMGDRRQFCRGEVKRCRWSRYRRLLARRGRRKAP